MTNEQKQLEFEASEVLEMLEDMVEYAVSYTHLTLPTILLV